MRSLGWHLALIFAISFVGMMVARDLAKDASPAATYCAKAEKAGYDCEVSPTTFVAQVVKVDDGIGGVSVTLIVSDGKKIVQVIPLQ